MMKRVFLIVLDSCGAGAMPDSEKFGDVGVHTLKSCATSDKLHIPTLKKILCFGGCIYIAYNKLFPQE